MSGVTIEIIFIGLIAFAEAGDGAVMLLVEEGQHHPLVYQQKGECDAGYGWCQRDVVKYPCPLPRRGEQLTWEASDLDLRVSNVDTGNLLYRKTRRRDACPTSSDDQNLGWLPGLDAFNWGFAPLKKSCLDDMEGCAIWSRFRLDRGSLTVCHFAHEICKTEEECRLKRFRVGSQERALGNALRLELDVKDGCSRENPENCPILEGVEARDPKETQDLSARLIPDDNGLIRLFVMNEPVYCKRNKSVVATSVDHYHAYYDLLTSPWSCFGGGSPTEVDEHCSEPPVGECEEALRDLTTDFCRAGTRPGFSAGGSDNAHPGCSRVEPHFGSECRDTSIP